MEEILDKPLNENERDETRINRITAFLRYFYCTYTGAWRIIIGTQLVFSDEDIYEKMGMMVGFSLNVLCFVAFVYYNIKQAALERKERIVMSAFRKPFMLVFLFYTGYLAVKTLGGLVSILNHLDLVPFMDIIPSIVERTVFGGILILILFREYIYLERLKNE